MAEIIDTEETINDIKLSLMGVIMLSGSYAALMKPADLKEWVSNEDVTKDGTDYLVPSTPLVAERSVSLHFALSKDNEELFWGAYTTFIGILQSGIIDLYVPRLRRHFSLKYETCTSFNNYSLKACEIAVKFTEPNPKKTD